MSRKGIQHVILSSAVAWLIVPAAAHGQSIADSVDYALEVMEPWSIGPMVEQARPADHDALQMLTSNKVTRGKPLRDYRCDDGPIDAHGVYYGRNHARVADRRCRELQFRSRNMDGVKQWGPERLRERAFLRLAEQAERETDVPATLLVEIARYQSGFLPGLVTTEGRYGLLQLKPELLVKVGIEPGNLLEPENNVRKGAQYLRQLFLRFRGLKMALAAYLDGPDALARVGDVPRDRKNLWFTREILGLYRKKTREFPKKVGAEAITWVWQWLE